MAAVTHPAIAQIRIRPFGSDGWTVGATRHGTGVRRWAVGILVLVFGLPVPDVSTYRWSFPGRTFPWWEGCARFEIRHDSDVLDTFDGDRTLCR